MPGAECWVLGAVLGAVCRVPGAGMPLAVAWCMGAKHFTELRAWQLARQLKVEVDRAILAKAAALADRKFCEQLSDAVRLAPRNLAEGFGRFGHREQSLIDEAEFDRLWKLSDEALASTTALLKYLTRRTRD